MHSWVAYLLRPACKPVEALTDMIDAGMDVARFNFSHGDHEYHREMLNLLREANKLRPDKYIAVMLDTKGPEIRTGHLKGGKPIDLKKDQELIIC